MNKKYYILTLLLVIFTFSCKKIEPPIDDSEANNPIYMLEGLLNNDSIKLYVNDTTVFISDEPYNMNGVEAYSTTISDLETGFELKMVVLRPEIFLDEEGIKLIEKGQTKFLIHQPICNNFSFTQGSNQLNYFDAEMNGNDIQNGNVMMDEYGIYDTKMRFTNIGSQIYTIPTKVGFKDEILNPYFDLTGSGNLMIYSASNSDLTHEWKLDDVVFSTMDEGEYVMTNGVHKVSHSITDTYNNTATHTTLVFYQGNQLNWVLNNSYCSPNVVENNYGRAFIEVMYNGVKYTSLYNMNNENNNIQISNIVYVVDSQTQTIDFVKFNIDFDAQLKTLDNSKTINLKNMKGTFHIAIN